MGTTDVPPGAGSPSSDVVEKIAALAAQGEAAYAAMYACRPSALHDLCEDAMMFLDRAAALAADAGLAERARALRSRSAHVRAVYQQLRT